MQTRWFSLGGAIFLSALVLSSCGGGSTSTTDEPPAKPTATVAPASPASIGVETAIVVTFDQSMDPSSLALSGTMAAESGAAVWSSAAVDNDTLTLSPASTWTGGAGTLTINAAGSAGTAIDALNLSYTVDAALPVASISPTTGSTITPSDAITITFNEAVDTQSFAAGGTLWANSDQGTWTTTTASNDTLTVSPATTWPVGGQTLDITASDLVGNSATVNLSYTVAAADADNDSDGYPASTDCNDDDSAVNPGASEICNLVDDNCDGAVDEAAASPSTWYEDGDTDGFGNAAVSLLACAQPANYVSTSNDCDDTDAAVSPSATESCNTVDDDCDGIVDNQAVDADTWYADSDADTFGDPAVSVASCTQPANHVAVAGDCDDTSNTVRPGAAETCNSVDDDCDGAIDEQATDATTWYRDLDSDGYGTAAATTAACSSPAGYSAFSNDCNDNSSSVRPGATELCNGIDDNCNGTTDEACVGP